jgi:hypothetical protein
VRVERWYIGPRASLSLTHLAETLQTLALGNKNQEKFGDFGTIQLNVGWNGWNDKF